MKRIDYTRAALAALLIVAAAPALAQDLSPVSDMIDNIIDAVTGPIGRGLGVLALVGSGVMMFFGRLNWPIFVAVFVGVVLIFSAETIIDGFAAPLSGADQAATDIRSPDRIFRGAGLRIRDPFHSG